MRLFLLTFKMQLPYSNITAATHLKPLVSLSSEASEVLLTNGKTLILKYSLGLVYTGCVQQMTLIIITSNLIFF